MRRSRIPTSDRDSSADRARRSVARRSVGRSALVVTAIGTAIGGLACDARATPSECTEMLDKYVAMVVAGEPEPIDLLPAEVHASREAKKAARTTAPGYRRASAQCTSEITRREYRCAMKAPTPETWQACID